jgi:hypothetical protein
MNRIIRTIRHLFATFFYRLADDLNPLEGRVEKRGQARKRIERLYERLDQYEEGARAILKEAEEIDEMEQGEWPGPGYIRNSFWNRYQGQGHAYKNALRLLGHEDWLP